MIRFFLALISVAVLLSVLGLALVSLHWIGRLPSYFFQTTILLFFSTSVLYGYLYKSDKPGFFVQLYFLTMGVKLLAYGVYNFFVIQNDKHGATENVIWFMILYLIFTALEIGFLYQKIRNG